jgi:hypothetical protein
LLIHTHTHTQVQPARHSKAQQGTARHSKAQQGTAKSLLSSVKRGTEEVGIWKKNVAHVLVNEVENLETLIGI